MKTKNATQKHAPGPFPLRMDCGIRNPDMFVIVTNHGTHFATTYDPMAKRLILAAPGLLAALREIVEHSEQTGKDCVSAEIAAEAIAKAEGREVA